MTDRFADAVERKFERIGQLVAQGDHADGSLKTQFEIAGEMADEAVDIPGWGRLFEEQGCTPEQRGMLDLIIADAALIWEAIERLKVTCEPVE